MKIGFIGAGKAGFSLGKYFCSHQLDVAGYFSRSKTSAKEAAEFTGTTQFENIENIVSASDILFITVPDGEISKVWENIVNLPIENKIICHCSGSLSSEVFKDAEIHGAYGYSVHPLYAINDKLNSYKEFQNAFFTVEGSEKQIEKVVSLIKGLGNKVQIISPAMKSAYHCAAVFASNFVVALAQNAMDLLKECGFDEDDARTALGPLMTGNVGNIASQGPLKALTGPIERGDCITVEQHMKLLKDNDLMLYKLLSAKLLEIAKKKNPSYDYSKLEKIITA